ncbi:hypothetical protein [Burkholderia cenocepacia]|uniref:hypothetical protein n=1 Tax=Burkholderia cenocepacia TaxID=95486 RepID=UPI002AAFA1D8|nr:hypothetical protein [Burkholderia cenocepacia]
MILMKIANVGSRGRSGLLMIDIDAGTMRGIAPQPSPLARHGNDGIDAGGNHAIDVGLHVCHLLGDDDLRRGVDERATMCAASPCARPTAARRGTAGQSSCL